MRRTALLVLAIAAIALGTFACDDSPSSPSGQAATFNLRITDSPFSDARAVLVTFSEVTAHRSESAWTTVPFAGGAASRTCDLQKLEGSVDIPSPGRRRVASRERPFAEVVNGWSKGRRLGVGGARSGPRGGRALNSGFAHGGPA